VLAGPAVDERAAQRFHDVEAGHVAVVLADLVCKLADRFAEAEIMHEAVEAVRTPVLNGIGTVSVPCITISQLWFRLTVRGLCGR